MTHTTITTGPFDGLDVPHGDWELTVFLDTDRQDYSGDKPNGFYGAYIVAAGSKAGRWRLKVTENLGKDEESGFALEGPPLVDLRDQAGQPDPLAALVALLTGRMA